VNSKSFTDKLLKGVEVKWMPLGEIAHILNGFAFKSSMYSDTGIRVIRISDVQKGKMSDKDLKYYPEDTAEEINRYLLQENDLVMSLTGNVGRVAMLSHSDLPAALNQRVACIRSKNNSTMTRYLFHFFDQDSFENEAMNNATGGGQKNMSTTWLSGYLIPIPCPSDPKRSLEIQGEIVRILDTFTKLTAELTAELTARKKQYNYYRDQLWSFEGKEFEWKTLGDIGDVRMCKRILKSQTESEGDIPFYKIGTFGKQADAFIANEIYAAYRSKYSFPKVGDVLISAAGTIGRAVVYDGKPAYFQDSNIVWLENDERIVSNRYLRHFYDVANWYVSTGGTIDRLYNDNIRKTKIPVPFPNDLSRSISEQARIVSILDKFDSLTNSITEGLPREIQLRQTQYEYYRDLLLSFPKPDGIAIGSNDE
jgi:type I restriction enzyme S subunit